MAFTPIDYPSWSSCPYSRGQPIPVSFVKYRIIEETELPGAFLFGLNNVSTISFTLLFFVWIYIISLICILINLWDHIPSFLSSLILHSKKNKILIYIYIQAISSSSLNILSIPAWERENKRWFSAQLRKIELYWLISLPFFLFFIFVYCFPKNICEFS